MIRLRQLSGSDAGRVMDVEAAVVRVGRMQDSEFALHPYEDLEVSARHAILEHDGVEWSITDVGSKNGTWVNGRRIVRWVVADGDEISLGATGPRIRIELPATLHVRVGEQSGEQVALPASMIEAQVVSSHTERPSVRATPKSGAPARSRSSVPPPAPPAHAGEARSQLPPPTIRPPHALPSAIDVPEVSAELLDPEDDDEHTRPIPPTIKTPLEKPDPAADSMPPRARPRASTFAIVVVSLSIGFALGFGFALAFASPS